MEFTRFGDEEEIRNHARIVCHLAQQHRWLIEIPTIKFYTHEMWKLIPDSWFEYFQCNLENMEDLLTNSTFEDDFPTLLRDYLLEVRRWSLSKQQDESVISMAKAKMENGFDIVHFRHLITRMKSKKVHEVVHMGAEVKRVCDAVGVNTVVDIGAGEGYVSHYLASEYGIQVIAVEKNERVVESGKQRIGTINYLMQRSNKFKESQDSSIESLENSGNTNGIESSSNPHFVSFLLNKSNLDTFQKHVDTLLSKEGEDIRRNEFVMVGLHTCGNLALMHINLFLDASNAKAMVNIGCCYHSVIDEAGMMGASVVNKEEFHVDLENVSQEIPYSQYVKSLYPPLNGTALHVGSQDCEGNMLLLHYRAIVEVVFARNFAKKNIEYRTKQVNVNRFIDAEDSWETFESYIKFSTRKPNQKQWEKSGAALEELKPQFEEVYHQFAKYYKVHVMRPVVETLIILDRVLYLKEKGIHNVDLIPIFDSKISPRNFALVAVK